MRILATRILTLVVLLLTTSAATAGNNDTAATDKVRIDKAGVLRWRRDGSEVALYGANYCVMSGSDYRMAGLVSNDRKRMIDEDLAHFARMGWTALRLCSWGDWENSDRQGNLVLNEHVDLLDYVVARAHERGIYILLTPIHTYDPSYADQVGQPTANVGFSRYFDRKEMGTNPASIAAQARYIGQLLNHVNPYTGVALKNEPAILFVEVINEPVHHPEDLKGSVAYINTLVKAVRDTGSRQITFFNVSQDFNISEAIRQSKVDGISFGWYPSSLVAGHMLRGNFLQSVDAYPDMLRPDLSDRPRIVYEFDQADLLTGYLYPAMARTFRSVGTQFATMFAYDMLQTAPYNLGWQTHYLNLVHTPRKAVSAIIAAEVMRRLPARQDYGHYPQTVKFGDFLLSYEEDLSELNAADAFMSAGSTHTAPKSPQTLQRVVGFGSSPVVGYEGTGAYFLDKVRDGVWRLELYPDEILVHDPFEQPQPTKVVSRLLQRAWPLSVHLPDLGASFHAQPIRLWQTGSGAAQQAQSATITATPGVWLLSRDEHVAAASLPATLHRVGFDEYHVNEPRSYGDAVLSLAPASFEAGAPVEIRARVATDQLADKVTLWVRAAGTREAGKAINMQRVSGNDYAASVDQTHAQPGLYEFMVSAVTGGHAITFPGAATGQPGVWPFHDAGVWRYRVNEAGATLRLLDPARDAAQLSFVRPGEQYRNAFFSIRPGEGSDDSALHLELPDLGADTPERYAASLFIGDAIANLHIEAKAVVTLHARLRASGTAPQAVTLKLIEQDGATWVTQLQGGKQWSEAAVPLAQLQPGRSILIPSPFPGLWNYWRPTPVGRGGAGDAVQVANVERLELMIERNAAATGGGQAQGVDVESVWLSFQ